MKDIKIIAEDDHGLTVGQIEGALRESLGGRTLKRVLILPPDFTRYHSNAGFITRIYDRLLREAGADVDIMPALGTHEPVSPSQWKTMFGDIPYDKMLIHDWRKDIVRLGEVPGEYMAQITDGLWRDPVSVEINRRVMEDYDLIISPGQAVFPGRGQAGAGEEHRFCGSRIKKMRGLSGTVRV